MICSFQPPFLGGLERRRQTSPLALFRVCQALIGDLQRPTAFPRRDLRLSDGKETRRLKVRRRAATEDDLAAGGRVFHCVPRPTSPAMTDKFFQANNCELQSAMALLDLASAERTCRAIKRPSSFGWVAIMKCAASSIVASAASLMHSLRRALARWTAGLLSPPQITSVGIWRVPNTAADGEKLYALAQSRMLTGVVSIA
jgi:hypothetical protein